MTDSTLSNELPVNYWYKDKKFLLFWCIQIAGSFIVLWFLFGPLMKITFENAGQPYYWWIQTMLILATLLPAWIVQIFGLSTLQNISITKKILITFGSYILGGVIVFHLSVGKKLPQNSLRATAVVILASSLVILMEVLLADLVMNLVKYIN